MPSSLFHPDIMDTETGVGSPHAGILLGADPEPGSQDGEPQESLRFALGQLSLLAGERLDCGGAGRADALDPAPAVEPVPGGVGFAGLQILEPPGSPPSCSPPTEIYCPAGFHLDGGSMLGDPGAAVIGSRKRSVNMTECVPVPSSEHVAEIVGRQGCKIKALRAKTNTYIKTPMRGEEPVFIVTGRREDVEMAKREILSAAEHFSLIRASRSKAGAGPSGGGGGGGGGSGGLPGPPSLPGQTTIQVRVPYRMVGLVVGPKGATIKRIQQQTHTYIVTPSRDKDPVFEVTGMPENVDRAREEIETHITLRTGAFLDLQGDDDFHSNGTDVSLDGLGALGLGLGAAAGLWSRAGAGAPPAALRHAGGLSSRKAAAAAAAVVPAAFLNGSADGPGGGGGGRGLSGSGSPTSPFSTGSAGFTFAGEPVPGVPAEELAFEFGAANIWAPFANGAGGQQRRNSSTLTPRLSPTQPLEPAPPEHPLARRAQSDPLSALSWLQAGAASFSGGSSTGGSSTGYSSCSASSLPGGSPTDSEGGGAGPGGALGPSKGPGSIAGAARDCCLCFESQVTAALVPCGHNLFCMDCAGQICESPEPECPVCHTPATQCIRIFS
ncbi:RNA-binding protein MEX3B-like [Lepisosteus oculatus]|uniref:RNA-binding protein MEX3B-like n=1 Tax=Lepisosteus oculatus TaxID=7918 RepID=UPI0037134ADF